MPAFEFKGLNRAGKEVAGVRDADSEKALRAALKREGIFITRVGRGQKKGQGLLATEIDFEQYLERISQSDIALFSRQLATLTKAGIPLVEAISATVDQTDKKKLRRVLAKVRQDVSEGSSLAGALEQHPTVFSPIFPNMIRAGEASGTLDQVLARLADFTENSVKLKSKVQSAMMYPIIMVLIGGAILAGLFVFVIPQITQIFEDSGQDLPPLTTLLIAASHFLRNYYWLMLMLVIAFFWGFRKWKQTPKGSYSWDKIKLRIPVVGKLILMIGVARFTRTLATLLRSGVPLLKALDITKNVLGNQLLVEVVEKARLSVKEGSSLADPLKTSGKFPPIVVHMIAIGEQSGALEDMLAVVSDTYESQVDSKIAGLTSLLEPLMILGMGITIGVIVFAVLLPIMQMNELLN
ncbi:MAG: type II secretion system inner membrane protein GspF [Bradymonadia bacterium]